MNNVFAIFGQTLHVCDFGLRQVTDYCEQGNGFSVFT